MAAFPCGCSCYLITVFGLVLQLSWNWFSDCCSITLGVVNLNINKKNCISLSTLYTQLHWSNFLSTLSLVKIIINSLKALLVQAECVRCPFAWLRSEVSPIFVIIFFSFFFLFATYFSPRRVYDMVLKLHMDSNILDFPWNKNCRDPPYHPKKSHYSLLTKILGYQ